MAIAQHHYANGEPVPLEAYPKNISATFLRSLYRKGADTASVDVSNGAENASLKNSCNIYRAQVPFLVTIPVMMSEFSVAPDMVEMFVYAPAGEPGRAGYFAMGLWKRWMQVSMGLVGQSSMEYPRVDSVDGEVVAVAQEQLDDGDYDEAWRSIKKQKHKAAGHPEDPFAFTCLQEGYKMYRDSTDALKGINV